LKLSAPKPARTQSRNLIENKTFDNLITFICIMKKAAVINALTELPKEFNLDELLDKLILIEKIDAGLADSIAGKTISHDRGKKMFAK
jgi:hypothetical protein